MAKIDILAVLLWESQNDQRALSAKEMSRAAKMIEYSNNKAAESLWVKIGQLPSVTEFNDDIHFTQTLMNWDWGLIDTTPRDQTQSAEVNPLAQQLPRHGIPGVRTGSDGRTSSITSDSAFPRVCRRTPRWV